MVQKLSSMGFYEKKLDSNQTLDGIDDEDEAKILNLLDVRYPDQLQKRVYVHLGMFNSKKREKEKEK